MVSASGPDDSKHTRRTRRNSQELGQCRNCGSTLLKGNSRCPNCGKILVVWWKWAVGVLLWVLLVAAVLFFVLEP